MNPLHILIKLIIILNAAALGKENPTKIAKTQNGNSKQETSVCGMYTGNYIKTRDYTCCKNETMDDAFHNTDHVSARETCSSELQKVDEDDLPTAMWRQFICMIKATGGDKISLKSFKGYTDFMTANYSEPLKSEILKIAAGCEGSETENDEVKRVQLFYTCLSNAEKKVCHKPNKKFKKPAHLEKMNGYCKKQDDFPYITAPHCCKGKVIPLDIPMDRNDFHFGRGKAKEMEKCRASFVQRQKKLGEKDVDEWQCEYACSLRNGSKLKPKEDLKIDFEGMKSSIFSSLSKSTRKDMLELFDKYIQNKKLYNMMGNSTKKVSLKKAAELMESQNESTKLFLYCDIQKTVKLLLEYALIEYCFDEKLLKWVTEKMPTSPSRDLARVKLEKTNRTMSTI